MIIEQMTVIAHVVLITEFRWVGSIVVPQQQPALINLGCNINVPLIFELHYAQRIRRKLPDLLHTHRQRVRIYSWQPFRIMLHKRASKFIRLAAFFSAENDKFEATVDIEDATTVFKAVKKPNLAFFKEHLA